MMSTSRSSCGTATPTSRRRLTAVSSAACAGAAWAACSGTSRPCSFFHGRFSALSSDASHPVPMRTTTPSGSASNLERPFEDKKILSGAELAEILGTLTCAASRCGYRCPTSTTCRTTWISYDSFRGTGSWWSSSRTEAPSKTREVGVVAGEDLHLPCRHRGLLPDRQRRQPAQVGVRVRRRVVRVLQGGLGSSQPGSFRTFVCSGVRSSTSTCSITAVRCATASLRLRRLRCPALRRSARRPREPADGVRPGGQDPRAAPDHREREQGGRGRCAVVDHGGQLADRGYRALRAGHGPLPGPVSASSSTISSGTTCWPWRRGRWPPATGTNWSRPATG